METAPFPVRLEQVWSLDEVTFLLSQPELTRLAFAALKSDSTRVGLLRSEQERAGVKPGRPCLQCLEAFLTLDTKTSRYRCSNCGADGGVDPLSRVVCPQCVQHSGRVVLGTMDINDGEGPQPRWYRHCDHCVVVRGPPASYEHDPRPPLEVPTTPVPCPKCSQHMSVSHAGVALRTTWQLTCSCGFQTLERPVGMWPQQPTASRPERARGGSRFGYAVRVIVGDREVQAVLNCTRCNGPLRPATGTGETVFEGCEACGNQPSLAPVPCGECGSHFRRAGMTELRPSYVEQGIRHPSSMVTRYQCGCGADHQFHPSRRPFMVPWEDVTTDTELFSLNEVRRRFWRVQEWVPRALRGPLFNE